MRIAASVVLLAAALATAPRAAHAAIACTVSVTGVADSYDPLSSSPTNNSGRVTLSCTRASGDPTSTTYRLRADPGLYATGNQRRMRHATNSSNYLNYGLYLDAARTQDWRTNNPGSFSGTLSFGTGTSASVSSTFYTQIPAGQTSAILGYYADTVIVSAYVPSSAASAMSTASLPVSATLPGSCSISSSPGAVSFSYVSFSPSVVNASTTFAVTCVAAVPYTLALDAAGGTLQGLTYTLGLSTASGTGTGLAQTVTIQGSMPAGQAGQCATATCANSRVHNVTISY
jgi:spore coat protein U-like protein